MVTLGLVLGVVALTIPDSAVKPTEWALVKVDQGNAVALDSHLITILAVGSDARPGGVVAVGDKLAVISVRAYTIELYDPVTLRGEGSQSVGLGPSHAVVDNAGRVYIADTRGGAITVYATKPRLKWIARVPLPGSPYGLAVDPRRNRVWATLTGRNQLVELTTGDRPREVGRRATVRQPNTIAVDPRTGRLLIASNSDGTLELVEP